MLFQKWAFLNPRFQVGADLRCKLIMLFDEAEELGREIFLTLKCSVAVAPVILGLLHQTVQSLNVQYCSFRQIEQKLQLLV